MSSGMQVYRVQERKDRILKTNFSGYIVIVFFCGGGQGLLALFYES